MVAEAPRKENTETNERIPVLTKRKARNLYLFEDASHERIAAECGITVYASQKLASSHGWVSERRQREANLIKKQDARMSGIDDEIIEAIASVSEQHTIRALQKTGEALERTDRDAAKDAQAYSATAKNLVGIARAVRDPGSSLEGSAPREFNLFFLTPAAPSEPKQVTEVEAVKVDSGQQ